MTKQFKCEGCGERAYYDICLIETDHDNVVNGRRCRLCGHEQPNRPRRKNSKRDERNAELEKLVKSFSASYAIA